MRKVHATGAFVVLTAALVVSACGSGGGSSTPSSRPAADPVGWKRCSNTYHGFSLAYPGSWHVASYRRLGVLSPGAAHRRQFFRHMVCLHYDPRPFTVHEATEGPRTAVVVFRIKSKPAFRNDSRTWFRAAHVRTIERKAVTVGGNSAIRFHVYLKRGAPLWDRSHVYGYLIDLGRHGGVVIETWRYGIEPVGWAQYRAHMVVVDRMARTLRVPAGS